MGGDALGVLLKPAFACGPFAVLCGMPVLRHDVLGGQGKDLGLSGADDHGGNGGMRIKGWASAALTGEAVLALHGFGRKIVGAIQGHQQLVAKDPQMRQHAVLFKALKALNKHRIEMARRDRIAERADLMVTGNLLHAQEGLRVIVTFGVLQPTLVLQTRRRLRKEDTQGAQGGILDGVSSVWPLFALVRE